MTILAHIREALAAPLRGGRRRLSSEQGFTLIELLIVLIIIGILLAIAVPSYLGFKERAEGRTAAANVRSAVPAMETYYLDTGSYLGATQALLAAISPGISSTLVVASADATSWCMEDSKGSQERHLVGPGGSIDIGPCP